MLQAWIGVAVGLVLLYAEHRTSWFRKTVTGKAQDLSQEPITTSQLESTVQRLTWVLGTVILVVPLTVGITWEIRRDHVDGLVAQLQAYEQSQEWELPQTLRNLRGLSQELTLSIDERKRLEQLDRQLPAIESANLDAEKRASELLKENTTLFARVEALEKALVAPATLQISQGDSAVLVENAYYLGVEGIYSSFVVVNLNNTSRTLKPGNQMTFESGELACTVTLKGIDVSSDRATFLLSCRKRASTE